MGVTRFTELVAWQLGSRLKNEIYRLTMRDGVSRDLHFCDQIRQSSASVPSNLAEGFARYTHRDCARFVGIARASLVETQDHLIDAVDRGHIDRTEFDRLWQLSEEAMAAVTGLLMYLKGGEDRPRPSGCARRPDSERQS